jgi:hypothetical protein
MKVFTKEGIAAFIILILATVLVVSRRVEGFINYFTGVPEGMCGVTLAPCPFGTRCMNGFCHTDIAPAMPPTSGLPVKPVGYSK